MPLGFDSFCLDKETADVVDDFTVNNFGSQDRIYSSLGNRIYPVDDESARIIIRARSILLLAKLKLVLKSRRK